MTGDWGSDLSQERTDDSLIAAERGTVGGMMLDGRVVAEVKSVVRPADFMDYRYEAICEVAFDLHQKGKPVDVITVGTRMRILGKFTGTFSESLLHELTTETPSARNAAYYGGIVAGGAARRRLRTAGLSLIGAADDPAVDILSAIDSGRGLLDDAIPGELGAATVGENIDNWRAQFGKGGVEVTRTPWPDLDALIHGWKPGRMVVVGARPAVGKTVVGVQVAMVAAQYGDVVYFTGEMDQNEITTRLFCAAGGIRLNAYEKDNATELEKAREEQVRPMVESLGLYVNDHATTWDEIETYSWDIHRRGRLKMIVIDYIGLYGMAGKYESRQQEMAAMSRRAKQLSKRLKITVVLLSQLGRAAVTSGAEKPPTMDTLRESGALEQDADLVILLHQKQEKDNYTKQWKNSGILSLRVEKQRNGPTGIVETRFEGAHARATHMMHAR